MEQLKVIKRNGDVVDFNKNKIKIAILKAMKSVSITDDKVAEQISCDIETIAKLKNNNLTIKQIEDYVFNELVKMGFEEVAKSYEGYRAVQEFKRNVNTTDESILGLVNFSNNEVITENANKQSTLSSTQRDLIAGEISKDIAKRKLIPANIVQAHNEGIIKLHDLDYFLQPITNCIDENGWICYKDENGVRNIQLKQLKNMFNMGHNCTVKINKKCFVLGRNGWTRLKAISIRPSNVEENKYEFSTRTGIDLKVTENHRIPIIREGNEILIEAKNIKKGDLLLTSNGLNINPFEYSNNSNYINLLNLDDSDLDLCISNIAPLRHYIRYKYDITIQDILNIPKIPKTITVKQLKKILTITDIPYDIFYKLKLSAKGSKTKLPLIIPVNESLAKLYGYIYADGGVYINKEMSNYQLTFTNTNINLIDDFINCFEEVFDFRPSKIKPCGTSPCWRSTVGSRIIVKLFKDFCEGKFNGSNDISIPDFIINGERNIKLAFLSSAIDCDGTLQDEQISYITCSEKYSGQITNMINSLGYHASMTYSNTKGSNYTFKHFNGYRNYDTYFVKLSRREDIYNFNNELTCYKNNLKYQEYKNFKSKKFIENKITNIKIRNYQTNVYDLQTESGWFIVNDYVVHNCELVPLDELFSNGTVINKKMIRTPKSLRTAATLMTQIALQISSLTYGGQTMSLSHLAPYVRVSYKKIKKELLEEDKKIGMQHTEKQIELIANERLKKEIKDSVQTINYQLLSMNSTNGQSPFISLCMYINENEEYAEETAMLIEEFLKQRIEGIENQYGVKSTQTFPKLLFFLDENNISPNSKYYYLKQLAIKATAKRMNPDYISVKKMKEIYGYAFPCINETCA